ncbi:unnamed protein product [Blepharisma stoltei]|uniref:Uncharacterized protein n=1 Tax=Blepharisma stoltei TaxID=1481888 RepID=A0AAU9KA39_9CILI|nr:unnamed protein product [Blepharisma stoltei]
MNQVVQVKPKGVMGKSASIYRIIFSIVFNLAFVIAVAIVLGADDGSCDKPIRRYLIIWVVVNGARIPIFVLAWTPQINRNIRDTLVCVIFVPGECFNFTLMIVGSVWEFTSDSCYDEFYNGWAMTLAVLIFEYVKIGLACLVVCGVRVFTGGSFLELFKKG